MNRLPVCLLTIVAALVFSVAADAAVIKEKKIRDAITEYITARTADSGMEIRIRRLAYSGDLTVPAGRVSFEIVAPGQWEGWGRANLGLIVRVDDAIVRNTSVPVEVEALCDMVVALRPLERGEVIGEGDVALQKRDISTVTGRISYDPVEVIGKKVRVGIRGNNPVRKDFLEKVPLVRSGQMVTIIAENGALRVTAPGRARNSGGEGDLIMVQNIGSSKDVQGRVVDGATVAVDLR